MNNNIFDSMKAFMESNSFKAEPVKKEQVEEKVDDTTKSRGTYDYKCVHDLPFNLRRAISATMDKHRVDMTEKIEERLNIKLIPDFNEAMTKVPQMFIDTEGRENVELMTIISFTEFIIMDSVVEKHIDNMFKELRNVVEDARSPLAGTTAMSLVKKNFGFVIEEIEEQERPAMSIGDLLEIEDALGIPGLKEKLQEALEEYQRRNKKNQEGRDEL